MPIARYYPLRFQCVRLLIKLSDLTPVFVPVLPFLLEMFDITDFNKRHKTASLKAQFINFDTSLKLSKLQMEDRAFKDGLMDQFYELVMLYLVHYAHHVTFPELVYPLILKCKKFIKVCKVQNFVKVIRGLLEKVQENLQLIEERRQKTGLNVKETKQMVRPRKFPPPPSADLFLIRIGSMARTKSSTISIQSIGCSFSTIQIITTT